MAYDTSRNAKVIISLALAAWIGGILVSREGVPAIFEVVYAVGFAVAVIVVMFYLIGDAGWRMLARRYRATEPVEVAWQRCPTAQMALVSVDHPDFQKLKTRFVGGSLRMATTTDALHLATMVSGLPILDRYFPRLRIPWGAVSRARTFEAHGWFAPLGEARAAMRAAYDPHYTGKFVEIEIGEPPVFIQLPAVMLGEGLRQLPGS
jgi:hypothetical protein